MHIPGVPDKASQFQKEIILEILDQEIQFWNFRPRNLVLMS